MKYNDLIFEEFHKGQTCIIDSKILCKEGHCNACQIKVNHTCECCLDINEHVQEEYALGKLVLVCADLDSCQKRMTESFKDNLLKFSEAR